MMEEPEHAWLSEFESLAHQETQKIWGNGIVSVWVEIWARRDVEPQVIILSKVRVLLDKQTVGMIDFTAPRGPSGLLTA
jgi:hypothetical protein